MGRIFLPAGNVKEAYVTIFYHTMPVLFDVVIQYKIQPFVSDCGCVKVHNFLLSHSFLFQFFVNESPDYGLIFEPSIDYNELVWNKKPGRVIETLLK